MGFIDWLMKGVEETKEPETRTATFDEKALQDLKCISNKEMQESTTLVQNNTSYQNIEQNQFQNNIQQQNPNMAYNQQNFNGTMPVQNMGMPLNTTQSIYMQQAPNQPFAPTTITIFQVAGEEDIKYALKHLAKKSPCAISFCKMNKKKLNTLYQFLKGGVFALGAKMVKWRGNDYLLTPRGMEISKQDKSKR